MAQMTLFKADEQTDKKMNAQEEALEQRRKEFEEEMLKAKAVIPLVKPEIKPEVREKPIEFFLNDVRISGGLWDLRCWDADHDIEEVRAWVQNPERLMSNRYVTLLIDDLLKRGVDTETIVKAVMSNDRVTWKKRVCKCYHDSNACPRYKEAGSYVMANCQSCRDVR